MAFYTYFVIIINIFMKYSILRIAFFHIYYINLIILSNVSKISLLQYVYAE